MRETWTNQLLWKPLQDYNLLLFINNINNINKLGKKIRRVKNDSATLCANKLKSTFIENSTPHKHNTQHFKELVEHRPKLVSSPQIFPLKHQKFKMFEIR